MMALTGIATAHFICPAKSSYGPAWAACNYHVTVDLFNDGQYDNFYRPEGWHIDIGFTAEETIVRCPSHCVWVGSQPHPTTGDEIPAHWEDSPLPDAHPIKGTDQ